MMKEKKIISKQNRKVIKQEIASHFTILNNIFSSRNYYFHFMMLFLLLLILQCHIPEEIRH